MPLIKLIDLIAGATRGDVHGFVAVATGRFFPYLAGGDDEDPPAVDPNEQRLRDLNLQNQQRAFDTGFQQDLLNEALTPMLLKQSGIIATPKGTVYASQADTDRLAHLKQQQAENRGQYDANVLASEIAKIEARGITQYDYTMDPAQEARQKKQQELADLQMRQAQDYTNLFDAQISDLGYVRDASGKLVPGPDAIAAKNRERTQLVTSYKSAGYDYDPVTGEVKPTSETQALMDQERQIQKGANELSIAYLSGTGPVSKSLETELERGQQILHDDLARRLGPGYATSSPGIEALREFDRSAVALRDAERFGRMTSAETVALSRGEESRRRASQIETAGMGTDQIGYLRGDYTARTGGRGAPATYYSTEAGRLGLDTGRVGAINQPYDIRNLTGARNTSNLLASLQPYQSDRAMQAQYEQSNQANTAGYVKSGTTLLGGIGIAALASKK